MTDQNTFMEVVQNVAEIVRTAEVPMAAEEILAYFSDMDLDESQKKLVLEYIMTAESREQEQAAKEQDETQGIVAEEEDEAKSKVFQMYLEELAMLPAFTAEERKKLYVQLEVGEESVIETISTAWLKKVLTIAEKYLEPRVNVEDLVQEGNMALFMKLQDLLGKKQEENIEDVLSAAVEEGIMSYCSELVGERELENTLVGKISLVHEAKKLLAVDKDREPTMDELAEYTKMSKEELLEIEDFFKKE
jgi:RNA polymerase primary sigma factor